MNALVDGGLSLPVYSLIYTDRENLNEGVTDEKFEFLIGEHLDQMSLVRAALAWAAKKSDHDYSGWVEEWHDGEDLAEHLRIWHETLEEQLERRSFELPTRFDEPVRRLSEVERQALRADIIDGRLWGRRGPVDTTQSYRLLHGRGVGGPYVLRRNGQLLITNHGDRDVSFHSSMAGDEPVACAGFMNVREGEILRIDRRSGHYETTPAMLDQLLDHLSANGVELSGVEVHGR